MTHPRHSVALIVETSNSYAREVLHGIRAWLSSHDSSSIWLLEQGRGSDVPEWLADLLLSWDYRAG